MRTSGDKPLGYLDRRVKVDALTICERYGGATRDGMQRMKHKGLAGVLLGVIGGVAMSPAWCDQWTGALTPTSAQVANYNGALSVYVTTTQPVVNPANCVATDGWVAIDPVFSKEALAMALTAIAAGHQIQLFVSSTQCAQNRPMILDFQVNW